MLRKRAVEDDHVTDHMNDFCLVDLLGERVRRFARIIWSGIEYSNLEELSGVERLRSRLNRRIIHAVLADMNQRLQVVGQRTKMRPLL